MFEALGSVDGCDLVEGLVESIAFGCEDGLAETADDFAGVGAGVGVGVGVVGVGAVSAVDVVDVVGAVDVVGVVDVAGAGGAFGGDVSCAAIAPAGAAVGGAAIEDVVAIGAVDVTEIEGGPERGEKFEDVAVLGDAGAAMAVIVYAAIVTKEEGAIGVMGVIDGALTESGVGVEPVGDVVGGDEAFEHDE